MTEDPLVIGARRKIDPTRRPAQPPQQPADTRRPISDTDALPDGSPNDENRVEIGPTDLAFREWAALGLTPPNLEAMRAYRHARLVREIQLRGLGGVLMFDPLNIRYATDTTNMQLWISHNPSRACLVLADGTMILYDFHHCEHLSAHLPLVTEVRGGASLYYFKTGPRTAEMADRFAAEIDDLMRTHAPGYRGLAVDKIELAGSDSLRARGLTLHEGQAVTEHARKIKSAEEIRAMRCAIATCEAAMAEMEAALTPGMTEVEAWAVLQHGNHIRGGEWIETRILSSGPRTNPWFQECGPRRMRDGEILAYDTDLIGPYGYCADLSRTCVVGDADPGDYARDVYKAAREHIRRNMEILRPGATFRELAYAGDQLPTRFRDQRYGVKYHGVGLCDEYPAIRYPEDWSGGYDGVLEPGMCLCVEVYYGEVGGPLGIKLEDQVVITETGYENLTRFPFDPRLSGEG
ncbi:MAG: Xaa-Pro peptidase family protein [Pseudomonadota bacterium]